MFSIILDPMNCYFYSNVLSLVHYFARMILRKKPVDIVIGYDHELSQHLMNIIFHHTHDTEIDTLWTVSFI
jgi:ACT domain-containing protein